MGNKIPWERASKIPVIKNKGIYAPQNKYGYRYNISHPLIRPLYEAYKERCGTPILSDKERFMFEAALDVMFLGGRGK